MSRKCKAVNIIPKQHEEAADALADANYHLRKVCDALKLASRKIGIPSAWSGDISAAINRARGSKDIVEQLYNDLVALRKNRMRDMHLRP